MVKTAETGQIARIIAAEMPCSVDTAHVLMEKRADLIGCKVGAIADAVIERRLRFDR
jgi:hypothetical protein